MTDINSLPLEILHKILYFLHHQDILAFTATNICARTIYNDKLFWIRKLDIEHGTQDMCPSHYVTLYADESDSGIKIFIRWNTFYDTESMVRYKHNDTIVCRVEKYGLNLKEVLNDACKFDNLELLKYGWSKQAVPTFTGVRDATQMGNLHILQWLNTVPGISPNIDVFYLAAQNGRLHILQWLETEGVLMTINGANLAAINNHLHIIQWFATMNIFPDMDGVNRAASKGHLYLIQWLHTKNILPNTEGANQAASKGHLRLLQWLDTKNIIPNIEGANQAASGGYLHILEWLNTKNIIPNIEGANRAASGGYLQILEWLETKDILPTEPGATRAHYNKRRNIVRWLRTRNIYSNAYSDDLD